MREKMGAKFEPFEAKQIRVKLAIIYGNWFD